MMDMITMKKATIQDAEWAYDIFYRAHRKLISEGKGDHFGGMEPNDVIESINNGDIYLFYRKRDSLPIMAISILRNGDYRYYDELLTEIISDGELEGFERVYQEEVVILNAVAVRPELWGQGYCRKCVEKCIERLKEQGFKVVVGNYYYRSEVIKAMLKEACKKGKLHKGKKYIRQRKNGEILERKRFAFVI